MEIIDFHTHIYPQKISQRAVRSVGEFYNLHMDCDGTAAALLKLGAKCGVKGYVVCSVAVDENHVDAINNYILSECEAHSEFYGFGTMHADYENKIDELERIFSLNLYGLKIHPDTQKFNMDDERMFPVYDYLSQTHKPILIHCGDYRYDYSHPKRLVKVLDNFPNLTVVAAHFGGWSIFDLALEYLEKKNCYLDTSSSIAMIGERRAQELIRLYGADRIVFGTDFPMWRTEDELAHFEKMSLNDEERELIFRTNAERILGIDA